MPVKLSSIELSLRLSESGEEIPVYSAQTVNPGILTASIPSEVGKSFEIALVNKIQPAQDLEFTATIDGRKMRTLHCHPFAKRVMEGVSVADDKMRPFTFSKLELKEDDGEEPSCDLSKLGLIEVSVRRIVITETGVPQVRRHTDVKAALDPVSEKAKKVGWHSVSLGAVKDTGRRRVTTYNRTCIDSRTKPYAIFRFWYKPIELLEDEGIAPRPEPVVKPKETKKRPRLDDDENTASAKKPALERDVKPDISQLSASSSKVKVEGAKHVKSEVIDLTNTPHSPIRVPVKGEVIEID